MKNEEKWHGKLNHFWTFNEFGSRFRMLPVSLVSDFGCNELVSDWVDNILTIALGSPQDDNCKEISAAENEDWQTVKVETFTVTLPLNTAIIHSCHKTLWLMMAYHQTEFICERVSSFADVVGESCILNISASPVTTTQHIAQQSFQLTLSQHDDTPTY